MSLETSYLGLPELFYTRESPAAVAKPASVIVNESLAVALGFASSADFSASLETTLRDGALFDGAPSLCLAYAGHQFGHLTMLGDGRAHLLCERMGSDGIRYDVQLKGSGRTTFSRRGDGLATLGPMLREYLISEAMAALGIPSTRSLAVFTTGMDVWRETAQPGAVLVRVARSHLRVGTFQYAAALGAPEHLKRIADFTIARHYPEVKEAANPYLELLRCVAGRQIDLVARWMLVGFIHGVMNTDNMALSGETIDYGPCAFMNGYNRETVYSSIDHAGRYSYGAQPSIAFWNLERFAETLLPLLDPSRERAVDLATEALEVCPALFERRLFEGFGHKIGLAAENEGDRDLICSLLVWMEKRRADFTRTFRQLGVEASLISQQFDDAEFKVWHERWHSRLAGEAGGVQGGLRLMNRVNPVVIPRNHQVEAALHAAVSESNLEPFHHLLKVLQDPFNPSHDAGPYVEPPSPHADKSYRTFCGT